MKINRVSEEMSAPNWAFEKDSILKSAAIDIKSAEELNEVAIRAEQVNKLPTEDSLISEKEMIEKCASTKSKYYFNSQWPTEVVKELKEYSQVCGMSDASFSGINPSDFPRVAKQDVVMIRTASKETSAVNIGDVFNLETSGDTDRLFQGKWQDVEKQKNLPDRPSMKTGIVPVRGGENYQTHGVPKVAKWENSMENPESIKKWIADDKMDTGARLRKENEDKRDQHGKNHKEWESDKVAAMEHLGIIPKGKVFPTEVMNAQSGLNTKTFNQRVYNTVSKEDIPDKTDGEKLADMQEARRKSIQREKVERQGDTLQKAPVRNISEDFAQELQKFLGQKGE